MIGMNIENMSVNEMMMYFRGLELEEVVNNVRKIKKWDLNTLSMLFWNVNKEIKKYLLDTKCLFDKIMSISQNRNNRLVIEIVDDEIRDYILRNSNLKNSVAGKRMVVNYLSKLNYNKFSRIIDEYGLSCLKNEISILKEFDRYKVLDLLDDDVRMKKINPVYLIKIKNGYEFFIYEKFELLVDVCEVRDNYIYFAEGVRIDYSILLNVNRSHITKLIKMLKDRHSLYDNNQLFVSVIKLYMIFGFDDSKKVIEDFYTYNTEASLKRASLELFLDNRREFRLKNQEKYYYFGIEEDILDAIEDDNKTIFKNICLKNNDKYIEGFVNKIKSAISGKDRKIQCEIVKKIIVDEISHRENYYKEIDVLKYKEYYLMNARHDGVSVLELYEMFKDIEIVINLDEKGHIIKNRELIRFLLGNCKRDNDCLLRLVLNKQALGLNRELYNIINNFDRVKECISKNRELSLYSLLDVIDISKTFLYDLKPDELDITLETLSKILNSRRYLEENPEEIVRRVLELHKLRKQKIWGTIPLIRGNIDGNKYQIVDFDEQSLLTSGIDGEDCLKVGGKGEEFLRYCLISPNGAIMYLYYNGTKYILPCSRNGNMVNINSIDPKITSEEEANNVLSMLEKIVSLWVFDDCNGIELVTITDVHMEDYIKAKNYDTINFDYAIPLDVNVYTDYNKDEVTNYIIMRKDRSVVPNYCEVRDRYYQSRPVPYIYITGHEADTERIEIFINNIWYSSIDYLNCGDEKKREYKENYELLRVSDFLYIVGNKDWFMGIDTDYNIKYYVLPYDDRVLEEFDYYKEKMNDIINDVKGHVKKKKL